MTGTIAVITIILLLMIRLGLKRVNTGCCAGALGKIIFGAPSAPPAGAAMLIQATSTTVLVSGVQLPHNLT